MKKYLLVRVDTNDADYVEQLSPVTDDELAFLIPLFEAIKRFEPYKGTGPYGGNPWLHTHNWPTGDILRYDLGEKSPEELYPDHAEAVEIFDGSYVPYAENGCHTIESIRLLEVVSDVQLLD
jgi:hypothetical protein